MDPYKVQYKSKSSRKANIECDSKVNCTNIESQHKKKKKSKTQVYSGGGLGSRAAHENSLTFSRVSPINGDTTPLDNKNDDKKTKTVTNTLLNETQFDKFIDIYLKINTDEQDVRVEESCKLFKNIINNMNLTDFVTLFSECSLGFNVSLNSLYSQNEIDYTQPFNIVTIFPISLIHLLGFFIIQMQETTTSSFETFKCKICEKNITYLDIMTEKQFFNILREDVYTYYNLYSNNVLWIALTPDSDKSLYAHTGKNLVHSYCLFCNKNYSNVYSKLVYDSIIYGDGYEVAFSSDQLYYPTINKRKLANSRIEYTIEESENLMSIFKKKYHLVMSLNNDESQIHKIKYEDYEVPALRDYIDYELYYFTKYHKIVFYPSSLKDLTFKPYQFFPITFYFPSNDFGLLLIILVVFLYKKDLLFTRSLITNKIISIIPTNEYHYLCFEDIIREPLREYNPELFPNVVIENITIHNIIKYDKYIYSILYYSWLSNSFVDFVNFKNRLASNDSELTLSLLNYFDEEDMLDNIPKINAYAINIISKKSVVKNNDLEVLNSILRKHDIINNRNSNNNINRLKNKFMEFIFIHVIPFQDVFCFPLKSSINEEFEKDKSLLKMTTLNWNVKESKLGDYQTLLYIRYHIKLGLANVINDFDHNSIVNSDNHPINIDNNLNQYEFLNCYVFNKKKDLTVERVTNDTHIADIYNLVRFLALQTYSNYLTCNSLDCIKFKQDNNNNNDTLVENPYILKFNNLDGDGIDVYSSLKEIKNPNFVTKLIESINIVFFTLVKNYDDNSTLEEIYKIYFKLHLNIIKSLYTFSNEFKLEFFKSLLEFIQSDLFSSKNYKSYKYDLKSFFCTKNKDKNTWLNQINILILFVIENFLSDIEDQNYLSVHILKGNTINNITADSSFVIYIKGFIYYFTCDLFIQKISNSELTNNYRISSSNLEDDELISNLFFDVKFYIENRETKIELVDTIDSQFKYSIVASIKFRCDQKFSIDLKYYRGINNIDTTSKHLYIGESNNPKFNKIERKSPENTSQHDPINDKQNDGSPLGKSGSSPSKENDSTKSDDNPGIPFLSKFRGFKDVIGEIFNPNQKDKNNDLLIESDPNSFPIQQNQSSSPPFPDDLHLGQTHQNPNPYIKYDIYAHRTPEIPFFSDGFYVSGLLIKIKQNIPINNYPSDITEAKSFFENVNNVEYFNGEVIGPKLTNQKYKYKYSNGQLMIYSESTNSYINYNSNLSLPINIKISQNKEKETFYFYYNDGKLWIRPFNDDGIHRLFSNDLNYNEINKRKSKIQYNKLNINPNRPNSNIFERIKNKQLKTGRSTLKTPSSPSTGVPTHDGTEYLNGKGYNNVYKGFSRERINTEDLTPKRVQNSYVNTLLGKINIVHNKSVPVNDNHWVSSNNDLSKSLYTNSTNNQTIPTNDNALIDNHFDIFKNIIDLLSTQNNLLILYVRKSHNFNVSEKKDWNHFKFNNNGYSEKLSLLLTGGENESSLLNEENPIIPIENNFYSGCQFVNSKVKNLSIKYDNYLVSASEKQIYKSLYKIYNTQINNSNNFDYPNLLLYTDIFNIDGNVKNKINITWVNNLINIPQLPYIYTKQNFDKISTPQPDSNLELKKHDDDLTRIIDVKIKILENLSDSYNSLIPNLKSGVFDLKNFQNKNKETIKKEFNTLFYKLYPTLNNMKSIFSIFYILILLEYIYCYFYIHSFINYSFLIFVNVSKFLLGRVLNDNILNEVLYEIYSIKHENSTLNKYYSNLENIYYKPQQKKINLVMFLQELWYVNILLYLSYNTKEINNLINLKIYKNVKFAIEHLLKTIFFIHNKDKMGKLFLINENNTSQPVPPNIKFSSKLNSLIKTRQSDILDIIKTDLMINNGPFYLKVLDKIIDKKSVDLITVYSNDKSELLFTMLDNISTESKLNKLSKAADNLADKAKGYFDSLGNAIKNGIENGIKNIFKQPPETPPSLPPSSPPPSSPPPPPPPASLPPPPSILSASEEIITTTHFTFKGIIHPKIKNITEADIKTDILYLYSLTIYPNINTPPNIDFEFDYNKNRLIRIAGMANYLDISETLLLSLVTCLKNSKYDIPQLNILLSTKIIYLCYYIIYRDKKEQIKELIDKIESKSKWKIDELREFLFKKGLKQTKNIGPNELENNLPYQIIVSCVTLIFSENMKQDINNVTFYSFCNYFILCLIYIYLIKNNQLIISVITLLYRDLKNSLTKNEFKSEVYIKQNELEQNLNELIKGFDGRHTSESLKEHYNNLYINILNSYKTQHNFIFIIFHNLLINIFKQKPQLYRTYISSFYGFFEKNRE